MSIAVTGTQYIVNTSPAVLTYPISLGVWVRPTATTAFRGVWALTRTGDDTHRFALYTWSSSQWNALISVAGTDTSTIGGTITANGWTYVVCRWISATNHRIDVLNNNGSTSHTQDTTSATPTSLTELAVGANSAGSEAFVGSIAEMFYTNTDIQADGAALNDSTLRQLAYGGPFSVPHIVQDILEYRSFRKHPFRDEPTEVYYGGKGIQIWTPTSTPTTGFHPPLPYSYVNSGQTKSVLTI